MTVARASGGIATLSSASTPYRSIKEKEFFALHELTASAQLAL